MARTTAPLFSLSARGQIGQALIFQKNKGRNVVKSYARPSDPKTLRQLNNRALMRFLINSWKQLWPDDRQTWIDNCPNKVTGGYNFYLQQNLKSVRAGTGLQPQFPLLPITDHYPATFLRQTIIGDELHAHLATDSPAEQFAFTLHELATTDDPPTWSNVIDLCFSYKMLSSRGVFRTISPGNHIFALGNVSNQGELLELYTPLEITIPSNYSDPNIFFEYAGYYFDSNGVVISCQRYGETDQTAISLYSVTSPEQHWTAGDLVEIIQPPFDETYDFIREFPDYGTYYFYIVNTTKYATSWSPSGLLTIDYQNPG